MSLSAARFARQRERDERDRRIALGLPLDEYEANKPAEPEPRTPEPCQPVELIEADLLEAVPVELRRHVAELRRYDAGLVAVRFTLAAPVVERFKIWDALGVGIHAAVDTPAGPRYGVSKTASGQGGGYSTSGRAA